MPLVQSTLIIMRTAAIPPHNDKGHTLSAQLGGRLLIAQLNAAARAVSRTAGVPLVDCETHTAGLTTRQVFRCVEGWGGGTRVGEQGACLRKRGCRWWTVTPTQQA